LVYYLILRERDTIKHQRTGKYKLTTSEENAGSVVAQDTLLHLETLLVVSAGNSEDVALVLVTQNLAFNLLTHSSVVEGTAKKRVSGFVLNARADLGVFAGQRLTCAFHRQFQSFFGHRLWDR